MAFASTSATPIMVRSESKPCSPHLHPSEEYQVKYCSLCDEYFRSKNLLRQHMETSDRHTRCDLCEKSFLNMNSLRRHLLLSNRHHYCTTCEKSFDGPLALKIHLEYTPYHRDERNEDEDTLYTEERRLHKHDWENRVAAEIIRRENLEDTIVIDEREELSRIQVTKKILALKQRMSSQKFSSSSKILKQSCAICLCVSKKMCVTRCGHLFCSSCINQTFEQGQGCPTCRKLGTSSQLRKVDLAIC